MSRTYAETLAERNPQDPCPTCEQVGGYCGGENHPSCGLFADGRPAAAEPALKLRQWIDIGATAPLDAGPDDPGVVWVAMAALLADGCVAVNVAWRPADAADGGGKVLTKGHVTFRRHCADEAQARAWAAQMLSELST